MSQPQSTRGPGPYGTNWLDLSNTSNRYIQTYIKGFLDISGGNLILRNNNFFVEKGDVSLNGRLYVGGNATIDGKILVNGDLLIDGKILPENSINPAAIEGLTRGNFGDLTFENARRDKIVFDVDNFETSFYQDTQKSIYVVNGGDVSINGNLSVAGTGTSTIMGDVSLNGFLYVGGDVSINGNIYVPTLNIPASCLTNIPNTTDFGVNDFTGSRIDSVTYDIEGFETTLQQTNQTQSTIYSTADLSINGNFFCNGTNLNHSTIQGTVGINNNLTVLGDITIRNGGIQMRDDKRLYGANFNSLGGPTFDYIRNDIISIDDENFELCLYMNDLKINRLLEQWASSNTNDMSINGALFCQGFGTSYFCGDLSLGKNLYVFGNTIAGNIMVDGDASFGRIFISGDSSLNGNLSITNDLNIKMGNLNITNNATINNSLYVSGDASFNSRLSINSDVSFNKNVFIGGDTKIYGKLLVDNDVSFNKRLSIGNDVSFNGNVTIGGDSNIYGKLQIFNDVSMQGNLTVAKDVIIYNRLIIGSDISCNGGLYLGSDLSMVGRLYVGGDASFNRNVAINGNVTLGGQFTTNSNVKISNSLTVTNDASFSGNCNISGNSVVGGYLFVGGNTTITNNLTTYGDISCNGKAIINNDFISKGKLFTYGDASFGNRLFMTGDISTNGNISVLGDAILNSRIFINGDASLNSRLFVGGDASFNSRLYVSSDVSINSNLFVLGDVSLNNNLYITGNLTFGGTISMNNDITLTGNLNLDGDLSMNNRLFVNGNTQFSNNMVVLGDVSLNSRMFINKDTFVNGNIYSAGNLVVYKNLGIGLSNPSSSLEISGTLFINTGLNEKIRFTPLSSSNVCFGIGVVNPSDKTPTMEFYCDSINSMIQLGSGSSLYDRFNETLSIKGQTVRMGPGDPTVVSGINMDGTPQITSTASSITATSIPYVEVVGTMSVQGPSKFDGNVYMGTNTNTQNKVGTQQVNNLPLSSNKNSPFTNNVFIVNDIDNLYFYRNGTYVVNSSSFQTGYDAYHVFDKIGWKTNSNLYNVTYNGKNNTTYYSISLGKSVTIYGEWIEISFPFSMNLINTVITVNNSNIGPNKIYLFGYNDTNIYSYPWELLGSTWELINSNWVLTASNASNLVSTNANMYSKFRLVINQVNSTDTFAFVNSWSINSDYQKQNVLNVPNLEVLSGINLSSSLVNTFQLLSSTPDVFIRGTGNLINFGAMKSFWGNITLNCTDNTTNVSITIPNNLFTNIQSFIPSVQTTSTTDTNIYVYGNYYTTSEFSCTVVNTVATNVVIIGFMIMGT